MSTSRDRNGARARPRIGFEIELLAAPGRTRRGLAAAIARRFDAAVRPALVACQDATASGERRYSLRPAFDVVAPNGRTLARLVDDVSIGADLDRDAPSVEGWGRVVSPDWSLIRDLQARADAGLDTVQWLRPLETSHGAVIEPLEGGLARAVGPDGGVLAVAGLLPGERERPAEVISPPLTLGQGLWLDTVLAAAADEGCMPPQEAAVHLHFDAAPVRHPGPFQRLVTGFLGDRDRLRTLVGTNPSCRALGPWPDPFVDAVQAADFAALPWPEAAARLRRTGLAKNCDLNVRGVVGMGPNPTIEFRYFPGSMDRLEIEGWADLSADCLQSWTGVDFVPTGDLSLFRQPRELATMPTRH